MMRAVRRGRGDRRIFTGRPGEPVYVPGVFRGRWTSAIMRVRSFACQLPIFIRTAGDVDKQIHPERWPTSDISLQHGVNTNEGVSRL
jgi:hypothetical protein